VFLFWTKIIISISNGHYRQLKLSNSSTDYSNSKHFLRPIRNRVTSRYSTLLLHYTIYYFEQILTYPFRFAIIINIFPGSAFFRVDNFFCIMEVKIIKSNRVEDILEYSNCTFYFAYIK